VLACISLGLCAMILHELFTTNFDPSELITNSNLAMTMTRKRAVFYLSATAASYLLSACSYLRVAPRATSKLAVLTALPPVAYLSYICFVATSVGFVRVLWLPCGGVLFGILSIYFHLEQQDAERELESLRQARYKFKKA